jgi:hypothetical protein
MSGERFVVLGLAHPRAAWFRDVARWSTSGLVPLEFLKCVTAQELTARLRAGRALSAVLLDGGTPGTDRDVIAEALAHGCVVIVVDHDPAGRNWSALGATAVLPSDFTPGDLITALDTHASPIGRVAQSTSSMHVSPSGEHGRLVAVCASGAAGATTVAMAVAQGLSTSCDSRGRVVLADFALDADMAVLHDVGDVIPSIRELVDAHRNGTPVDDDVRSYCFDMSERGYHLLLGLRRHREWTTIRPRAFDAALTTLRAHFGVVVADVSSDLEGEAQCGSIDVEERNYLARATTRQADAVVVVGRAGVKGVHRMVRLIATLTDHGVDRSRVLPVVNCAPRSRGQRAELGATLDELTRDAPSATAISRLVFLPELRHADDLARDGDPLPGPFAATVADAVATLLGRLEPRAPTTAELEPVAVEPGSLGTWFDEGTAT